MTLRTKAIMALVLAGGALFGVQTPVQAAPPTCNQIFSVRYVGSESSEGVIAVPAAARSLNGTSCVMGVGARSDAVERLQWTLINCYFASVNPDGIFGPQTREALKSAQRAERITADGIYGPVTRDKLDWNAGPTRDYPCVRVNGPGGA
ncbi:MAG TPA: peptidoglycan-binding domain-containing protein [Actinoplanes sp.]|jgi:hypothetical protein